MSITLFPIALFTGNPSTGIICGGLGIFVYGTQKI